MKLQLFVLIFAYLLFELTERTVTDTVDATEIAVIDKPPNVEKFISNRTVRGFGLAEAEKLAGKASLIANNAMPAIKALAKTYDTFKPFCNFASKLPVVGFAFSALDAGFTLLGMALPTTTTVNPVLAAVQQSVNEMKKTLDEVKETVNEIKADVKLLQEAVDMVYSSVKDVQSMIAEFNKNVQRSFQDISDRLSSVNRTVIGIGRESAYRDLMPKYKEAIWEDTVMFGKHLASDLDFSVDKNRTNFVDYCRKKDFSKGYDVIF